ncbi:hypothetical protein TI39_contig372g00013 [Zymoseptoria brevis]|uniref:COX assembly mitochondrial protein n=1 Tax=Zymoseptoria brevis TaxID=1047168 RepID=A0A0F4GNX8_9PEZI|nr:hypothetical protein TI39_contig372g00013 [Zymoseptoria brevis]
MASSSPPGTQASQSSTTLSPPGANATTLAQPNPKRSPLPLSASQESQVRELYFKRVRMKCADEVRDFASCCTAHTFTATFSCRSSQKAMNACMLQHATQAEHDAAREEWFNTIEERKGQREEKERKRAEDEKFWKEWWRKERKTEELKALETGRQVKPKDRKE